MNAIRIHVGAGLLLATCAVSPLAQAQAAGCVAGKSMPIAIGTLAEVPAGPALTYAITLQRGQGVAIDLTTVATTPIPEGGNHDDHEEHGSSAASATPRALALCGADGKLLAPLPGEVFAKGGSLTATDEGERLRFSAPASGQYLISVAAGEIERELLVRRRDVGSVQAPVVSAELGRDQKGIASSKAPMVFSFATPAGQWVELKSTSEKDTVLRLAGPDRAGDYSVIAENDDSDGLNPRIRRKLAVAGTYYLQVDSLSEEPGEFELSLRSIAAPKPPAPPVALRAGLPVSGSFADEKGVAVYALGVQAGRSYRIDVTASYDAAVAIGVSNPVEPDNGADGPDAGFTEIKSQDGGTTGTERLGFTARSGGTLLVRVKNFGIRESDGAYTITVNDLGN